MEEKQAQRGKDTCPRPHRESARLKIIAQASWPRLWPSAFPLILSFQRIPLRPVCSLTTPFTYPPQGWRISSYLPSHLSSSPHPQGPAQLRTPQVSPPRLAQILFLSPRKISQHPLPFLNHNANNGYCLLKHLLCVRSLKALIHIFSFNSPQIPVELYYYSHANVTGEAAESQRSLVTYPRPLCGGSIQTRVCLTLGLCP